MDEAEERRTDVQPADIYVSVRLRELRACKLCAVPPTCKLVPGSRKAPSHVSYAAGAPFAFDTSFSGLHGGSKAYLGEGRRFQTGEQSQSQNTGKVICSSSAPLFRRSPFQL